MKIIRLNDVITLVGLSKSTIYDRMRIGLFPSSFSLGGKAKGWLEGEILAYNAFRATECSEKELKGFVNMLVNVRPEARVFIGGVK